jgi:prepilin-type N-terminal cleavage/methylation domain-containing protein
LASTLLYVVSHLRHTADAIKQTRDKKKANSMLNKLNNRRGGFTLVEIMIVVAIIALLAAIAVPGFLRARKRSQASRIINDLRLIDSAVDQYAIETNKASGAPVRVQDWTNYLKAGTNLHQTGLDILGNAYGPQTVDSLPRVPANTRAALIDVTDTAFWSPYN